MPSTVIEIRELDDENLIDFEIEPTETYTLNYLTPIHDSIKFYNGGWYMFPAFVEFNIDDEVLHIVLLLEEDYKKYQSRIATSEKHHTTKAAKPK